MSEYQDALEKLKTRMFVSGAEVREILSEYVKEKTNKSPEYFVLEHLPEYLLIERALKEYSKFKNKTFELLNSALAALGKENKENCSLLDMFMIMPTIKILKKIKQELKLLEVSE